VRGGIAWDGIIGRQIFQGEREAKMVMARCTRVEGEGVPDGVSWEMGVMGRWNLQMEKGA
jgi:hypothetical protein